MVNLTIRLGKPEVGPFRKQEQGANSGNVVKGPSISPHLVDTDLPLLKGVGTMFSEPCSVNFVGVKARCRQFLRAVQFPHCGLRSAGITSAVSSGTGSFEGGIQYGRLQLINLVKKVAPAIGSARIEAVSAQPCPPDFTECFASQTTSSGPWISSEHRVDVRTIIDDGGVDAAYVD